MTLRILLGDARCAARHPDAIVVCPVERRVRNLLHPRQRVYPSRHALLAILLIRWGRVVTYDEICDYIWADDPDGGPLQLLRSVAVHTTALRHVLEGTPVGITTRWGLGLLAEPAAIARRATAARYYSRRQTQEIRP